MVASHFGTNLRNINHAKLQWNKFFPYFTSFGKSPAMEIAMVIIVASASEFYTDDFRDF
jgi:hypothetical protein